MDNVIEITYERFNESASCTLYSVVVNIDGVCVERGTIYKDFGLSYNRTMYNFLSAFRPTMAEIKVFITEYYENKYNKMID